MIIKLCNSAITSCLYCALFGGDNGRNPGARTDDDGVDSRQLQERNVNAYLREEMKVQNTYSATIR